MRYLAALCLLALVLMPLTARAQCTNCPGASPEAACACGQWHEYHGEAALTALKVTIEAKSDAADRKPVSDGTGSLRRQPSQQVIEKRTAGDGGQEFGGIRQQQVRTQIQPLTA